MLAEVKRSHRSVSVWPGYVDALAALLMVVIFVLLLFIFAHFLLSQILSGQESELANLHREVAELTELLGLEKSRSEKLTSDVIELSGLVHSLTDDRTELSARVEELSQQQETDQAEIKRQLVLVASLQEDIDALRTLREELEQRVGRLAAALDDAWIEAGTLRDRSMSLEAKLSDEQERTYLAQREVEQKEIRIQALAALVGEQKSALDEERRLSASARAEVVLLNRQLKALRSQLEEIGRALDVAERESADKEAEIKDLGKRLNIALARQVNRLEQYRSEFFGRLRQVLGENPSVRIEGDRFVLQAELLFESGSAELGESGKAHLGKLAETLREISAKIPKNINWILRIDGHTDRIPINNEEYPSNWELSTARALSVVRYLAARGIPEKRMAATGFSKFHPLDPRHTGEAYRKNRRIEIKLTSQ